MNSLVSTEDNFFEAFFEDAFEGKSSIIIENLPAGEIPIWAIDEPTPFDVSAQWFASAEEEGRTEDATEHKIRKAREEGKVAKSQELTGSIILIFAIITLGFLAPSMLQNALDMLRFFLSKSCELDVTSDRSLVPAFYDYFIRLAMPIAAVAFVGAVLGNLMQVGFLFTVKPIMPDFKKIIPKFGKFVQKAFLSGEALFNLGKSLFKVLVIGIIAYVNISAEIPRLINLINVPFLESVGTILSIAFTIFTQAALALLILSLADYYFQRRQHLESLKMSKQEIKEERKLYEGDPMVKSRLRQKMQELLEKNMIREVPKADVVITNPTHFAIALEWNRETMVSPGVIAKGVDNMALKIREIASENNIPMVENKPLARALYAEVEIGDPIPEKFYEVIALVLAEIYKLNGKNLKAG